MFRASLYVPDLRIRCCEIILLYNWFQPYHTHESTHEWVLYIHACLNFSELSCINTMTCVRSLKLVVHVVSMSSKFTLIWKMIQRRIISPFLFVWQMELFSDGSYITATGIYFEYFYKSFKDVGIDIITILVVLMSGMLSLYIYSNMSN